MANWTDHGPIPDNQTNSSSFSPFTAALGMTVTVIIITVNSIVLIVFLKTKSIRENRHHNLVICLSICDLTIGFSGMLASLRLLIPLSALNSAINPFVYSWKIESLRRELKLLFKCHCLESC